MPPDGARRSGWPAVVLALLAAGPVHADGLFRPSPLGEDEYTETFTFVADLDDGSYAQIQLAVTNLGPGAGNGLCRGLVKRPGQAAWTGHRRVGRNGWRHEAAAGERGEEVLAVGPCSVRSGETTRVRLALDGRTVELDYPGPATAREAPGSPIRSGKREYRSWILQSFTPVQARLEGFGSAAGQAGGGYADHSRTNLAPADLARRWIRFRSLRPPVPLLLLARERADGRWEPAWLWRAGESPRMLDAVELRDSGGAAAFSATIRAGALAASLASGELIRRHAPLEELGLVGSLVAPLFPVPVTYTFRATLAAPEPIGGILEITAFEK